VFAKCDDLLVMCCSNKNENTAVALQLRWWVLIIIILLPVRRTRCGSTDDLAEHAGQHASTWDTSTTPAPQSEYLTRFSFLPHQQILPYPADAPSSSNQDAFSKWCEFFVMHV
jgi:hypothetical protein